MYLLIMLTGSNRDNLTVSNRLGFYSTQGVQECQCLNTAVHTPVSGTQVRQASRSLTVLASDLRRGRKCPSKVSSTAQCHRMWKNPNHDHYCSCCKSVHWLLKIPDAGSGIWIRTFNRCI